MWQDFQTSLDELAKLYDILIGLAARKQAALAKLDIEMIDKLRLAEEKTVAAIESAEKRRVEILKKIAADTPDVTSEMGWYELCLHAPADLRLALNKASKELGEKAEKAKAASDDNVFLMQAALNAITYKLNRVGQTAVDQNYGPGGGVAARSHRKGLDFDA